MRWCVLLLAGLHVCVCRDDETKLEFGAIAKFTATPGGLHDAVAVLEDERRRPFGGQAVKLVVFIRHGEAEHNVAEAHAGHDMWYILPNPSLVLRTWVPIFTALFHTRGVEAYPNPV